jgi:hypothetical protein
MIVPFTVPPFISLSITMLMMMAVSFVMTLAFGSILSHMAVLSALIAVITYVIMAIPGPVKSPIMPIKCQCRLAENQSQQNRYKAGKK